MVPKISRAGVHRECGLYQNEAIVSELNEENTPPLHSYVIYPLRFLISLNKHWTRNHKYLK